ncbi:hypothetical protein [Klebsiella pneumoniae]|uniref:hypothetical protein n=1 Tax=Klebsiella pneumoniae TaxID=573 RepID=UPI001F4B7911
MDMNSRPDSRGGQAPVVESFIQTWRKYAPLIIKAVDKLGPQIEPPKIRIL